MQATPSATTDRIERTQKLLVDYRVDLLLLTPSADMRYLIDYASHASERPTLFALATDSPPLLVLPEFEAPRIDHLISVEKRTYQETESPFPLLSDRLNKDPEGPVVAISDQTWAAVLLRLQDCFPAAKFVPASPFLRQLRMIKSAEELRLLEAAGTIVDSVFNKVVSLQFSGRREKDIARTLNELVMEEGGEIADWGPIVASGPNASSPHHLTGDRVIADGDAVVLDFGASVQGYQADTTRTVHVGRPQPEFRTVYEIVRKAQDAGVYSIQPGVSAGSVDAATRKVIASAGYGKSFIHRTGHGIGLEAHEEPYLVSGNTLALQPGMTFSVEPGVYLSRRFGVRLEDIVAVTSDGARRLNSASRELITVH